MRRLTERVIKEVLQAHEGYHKPVPLYGCDITWHYVIKDGILKIYEVGKGRWSDSRFNDFADGTPIIANLAQVRRFIRKYLSY